MKEKSKPGRKFRLETLLENLRKQLKVIKQKKNAEINRKEKTTQEKHTAQLEEIHQKVLAKEGRLKRYRQRVKQYRQNRTFQNNERKFYQQLGESDTKTYQQPDAKETERFWAKIWEPEKHNENAEWINNITRELDGLEEGPKMEIPHRLTQNNTKKNIKLESARPWWNTWLLVQEIYLHSRKTSTRDEQMLTRRARTWMDDQRKEYINSKGP